MPEIEKNEEAEIQEEQELSFSELLLTETEYMQKLSKVSEDVPVFIDWDIYSSMFPAMMAANEDGVKITWFWLAKYQYGYYRKLIERNLTFKSILEPKMKGIEEKVANVFEIDSVNLEDFFSMDEDEANMINLAKNLGVPSLLTKETARYLFEKVDPKVRDEVLEKIKDGPAKNELKAALGFQVPFQYEEESGE